MNERAVSDRLLVDYRESDDQSILVELVYRKTANVALIHLIDIKLEQDIEFEVPPERANDAFIHPYAYAPAPIEAPIQIEAA